MLSQKGKWMYKLIPSEVLLSTKDFLRVANQIS
jgi:hypothetical protein